MSIVPNQRVYRVAVPVPLPGLFDYLPSPGCPDLRPGQRVLVPFGRRSLVGVVLDCVAESEWPMERLQSIAMVLDEGEAIVPPELLSLLSWCARYYKHPEGEVLFNALPPALRRQQGCLPPPRRVLALTEAGAQAATEEAGRAVARHRTLQALLDGPLTRKALREVAGSSASVIRSVLEKSWVTEEPVKPPEHFQGEPGPDLNEEQQAIVTALQPRLEGFSTHLVDGVTGSGKTEVYLSIIRQVMDAGRQALVLVPEIGLTPQLLGRFEKRLGIKPAVYHSQLSDGERLQAWADARRGDARLIVGTRSALFMPLDKPGLIILDESHDASFKQQDGFRYAAGDVAVKRAHALDIPVILGTATPSLESLHNAQRGRFQRHRLQQRATGAAAPHYRVVDLRQEQTDGGLSPKSLRAMTEALDREEQVLVFLNRRGYAPVLLCHECGWHAGCRHCDANLTWHRTGRRLHCHHCGHRQGAPHLCPECGADALQGAGEGTEQLERYLAGHFPETPLHRVDRDQVRRKGDMEALVKRVRGGESCILVGTQMLAKGHHFPRVTLVVIVSLDQALYSADFRATERMGQVLVQVAGRAGRAEHPGTVIVQTHHPEHPALQCLLTSGYGAFAEMLMEERRLALLPPYAYQAVLRAEDADRGAVMRFLEEARACFPKSGSGIYGPMPAMMERQSGRIRWYLLVQDVNRPALQQALDGWLGQVRALPGARKVRWTIDLDPQGF